MSRSCATTRARSSTVSQPSTVLIPASPVSSPALPQPAYPRPPPRRSWRGTQRRAVGRGAGGARTARRRRSTASHGGRRARAAPMVSVSRSWTCTAPTLCPAVPAAASAARASSRRAPRSHEPFTCADRCEAAADIDCYRRGQHPYTGRYRDRTPLLPAVGHRRAARVLDVSARLDAFSAELRAGRIDAGRPSGGAEEVRRCRNCCRSWRRKSAMRRPRRRRRRRARRARRARCPRPSRRCVRRGAAARRRQQRR